MREDYKKNFILLSQVAKEKKYAQEYLGLLARRGDLGSIRIGKRWYTTREWFEEFESDAKVRKSETKIEKKTIETVTARNNETAKKNHTPLVAVKLDEGHDVSEVREFPAIDLRRRAIHPRTATAKIFAERRKIVPPSKPPRNPESKTYETKRKEIKVWDEARGYSPSFLSGRKERFSFFPKVAYGAALVLMLFLLGWAGIAHKEEVLRMARLDSSRLAGLESGIVAGAHDSKTDLSAIKKSASKYLGDEKDRIKGNVSLTRVVLRAAVEKSNQDVKNNN